MNPEIYFELYKKNIEEKDKSIEQLRAIKHDTQAHYIVLQYYLEAEMYDKARQYLKELRSSQEITYHGMQIDTGNVLVNVVLEEFLSKDKEIQFRCDGKLNERVDLTSYELCVVFSNLISNALEACQKLRKLPKEINLKMITEENKFKIIIENYIEWNIDLTLVGRGTTKSDKDNHGYGIKNLKSIVKNHKGSIAFKVEENKFCVQIEIPMMKYYNEDSQI